MELADRDVADADLQAVAQALIPVEAAELQAVERAVVVDKTRLEAREDAVVVVDERGHLEARRIALDDAGDAGELRADDITLDPVGGRQGQAREGVVDAADEADVDARHHEVAAVEDAPAKTRDVVVGLRKLHGIGEADRKDGHRMRIRAIQVPTIGGRFLRAGRTGEHH